MTRNDAHPDRRFVFDGARFYSRVNDGSPEREQADDWWFVWQRGTPERGPLRTRRQAVTIHPPGATEPSDEPGSTWEQRTIAAELARADATARLAAAESSLVELGGQVAGLRRALREAQEIPAHQATQHSRAVWPVVQALAQVYERGDDLNALADDAPDSELEIDATDLLRFARETLERPHPSVTWPQITRQQREYAEQAWRSAIASGASVGDAIAGALSGVAGAWGATPPVPWRDQAPGAACPVCGHERGEHDALGRHCEKGTHAGEPCGCMGPMTLVFGPPGSGTATPGVWAMGAALTDVEHGEGAHVGRPDSGCPTCALFVNAHERGAHLDRPDGRCATCVEIIESWADCLPATPCPTCRHDRELHDAAGTRCTGSGKAGCGCTGPHLGKGTS